MKSAWTSILVRRTAGASVTSKLIVLPLAESRGSKYSMPPAEEQVLDRLKPARPPNDSSESRSPIDRHGLIGPEAEEVLLRIVAVGCPCLKVQMVVGRRERPTPAIGPRASPRETVIDVRIRISRDNNTAT